MCIIGVTRSDININIGRETLNNMKMYNDLKQRTMNLHNLKVVLCFALRACLRVISATSWGAYAHILMGSCFASRLAHVVEVHACHLCHIMGSPCFPCSEHVRAGSRNVLEVSGCPSAFFSAA